MMSGRIYAAQVALLPEDALDRALIASAFRFARMS